MDADGSDLSERAVPAQKKTRSRTLKTPSEVLKFAKDNKIEFYDFRFTDIKGTWHHVAYTVESVEAETFEGIPFDGSSIPAWQGIQKSDMLLKPDPTSAFIDPFLADPTLVLICDVYDIYKNQPYEKCPRSVAKKALQYLSEQGIGDVAYFGPENEFFIFDSLRVKDTYNIQYYEIDSNEGIWNSDLEFVNGEPNSGHRSMAKGGYFPVPPNDTQHDIRADIVKNLKKVGLEIYVVHHEVGMAQGEIGVRFGTLIEAADNVQKYKYVVKMTAQKHGKTATFMPKPLYGDNGNGMHTHQSIWRGGENLFAGDKYAGLSDVALNYIGGVLGHSRAIAAFTNASTNSYKRLQPGFEAPSVMTYSAQNRSAGCRIPYVNSAKGKRAEMRFPDSTANPYLAFSVMLMAGIDGIKKKTDPGQPMEEDLFELSLEELREKGIKVMPYTLREAINELKADQAFLRQGDVFTQEFMETYVSYKIATEVLPWEGRPHPIEFHNSYSC